MSVVETLRRFLERNDITGPLVVACSGGIDSTALILAFSELNLPVTGGHVNHHLRGAESDGDEEFVRHLCASLGVPLDVADGTLDPEAIRRVGVEAAAREVRQSRLRDIAAARGARYVATAHQKNDQAETIIMRIVTGTGLAGLRGIHPMREDGFIRPLLEVTREELEAFLSERSITPRVDSSNADPRYLRNRIRIILRELGPAAVDNAAAIAEQAQQVWPVLEASIEEAEKRFTRISESETRFTGWPDDPWLRRAILQRQIRRLDPAARDVSARDLERIASSLPAIRRLSVTRTLELVARRGRLVLRHVPQPAIEFDLDITPGSEVSIPQTDTTVRLRRAKYRPSTPDHQLFQLPPGRGETFTVRNRRRGDRFQPLGMSTDKKLKDFLIDRKIAIEIRDSIPLLLCEGEIVWVGGVEISERFKVTSPAGELYEVILEHGSHEGSHEDLQR